MPSFRLLFSIWKIPASKVSRTRPPYWLAFVWLRLRREKWKRCVRTYGCWVKFVAVVDGIFTRCPQSSFPSVSWRSLCLLGGHLLTQGGNSLSARVFHVNSCNWLEGGRRHRGDPARYSIHSNTGWKSADLVVITSNGALLNTTCVHAVSNMTNLGRNCLLLKEPAF